MLVIIFVSLVAVASGQTSSELLRLGNSAFERGNYASAAFFYSKLLGTNPSTEVDLVYPYALVSYTGEINPIADSLKTSQMDTAMVVDTLNTKSDSIGVKRVLNKHELKMLHVMSRLADSYRLYHDYKKAEYSYKKLIETNASDNSAAKYWYAFSLLQNAKYQEAALAFSECLNTYNKATEEYKKSVRGQKSALFAIEQILEGDTKNKVGKIQGPVNEGKSNFGAYFFKNDSSIIFTSSRSGNQTMVTHEDQNEQFFCDLFSYQFLGEATGELNKIGLQINENENNGAAIITPKRDKMFFTKWNTERKTAECAIYVCRAMNGMWLQPQRLDDGVNQPGTINKHPALSADGRTLYFSSNREGGQGKFDIWYCTVDEFGNVGEAKNMGKRINTAENEITPFFHEGSKELYFSSDGHIGMGGLDIYRTFVISENVTSKVENLNAPINSSRDDAYFVLNEMEDKGFMSSDREGCEDCDGGSCYKIYKVDHVAILITVSGTVLNNNGEPVQNTLIQFEEEFERMEHFFAFTDENGQYKLRLPKDMEFNMTAHKVKYFKERKVVNTFNINKSTNIVRNFNLQPLKDFILPIEYDYDKATLRPESKEILDDLTEFLEVNDHLAIEIGSHTDHRGSHEYNMSLARDRAKSVYDYLVLKGVEADRLTPKGYGEMEPLVKDAQTEAEHQRNRRTNFHILSEHYQSSYDEE